MLKNIFQNGRLVCNSTTSDFMSDKRSSKNPKEEKSSFSPVILNYLLIGFFLFSLLFFFNSSKQSKSIDWKEFSKLIEQNKVDHIVVINQEVAEIFLRQDTADKKGLNLFASEGPEYTLNIGSPEVFENKLSELEANKKAEARTAIAYEVRQNWFTTLLVWLIPFLILFMLWRWARSRMKGKSGGGSIFSFGQSGAQLFEGQGKVHVTFNDVAGLHEAKEEMHETVDFLKKPERYTSLGAKIPKGILLIGPPGTGKTLLAKAIAGEANVPFFSLSGSEFVEMFVGVGASRVRDLFKKAKEKAPCIVFIDELDAIGRSRGKSASAFGGNDERESTLNQMLTEMDGFSPNSGVIVLAATNRGDVLDQALLRPGRFDRHIYLELPDQEERMAIFKVHMDKLKLDDEVDVEMLAAQTPGFSGADIANACNEAALIAARKKRKVVGTEEFSQALDRIIGGIEKKNKVITNQERRIVAFHEAGHALATCLLKGLSDIVKVSIIPRGKSLGATWHKPEEMQLVSLRQLKNDISILLAGRVAEETIFGEATSGALDDLEKVSKHAYTIVAYYGLGEKMGNVSYYDSSGRQENSFQKPYSEETARIIDEEVRRLIESCYSHVSELFRTYKKQLERIGEMLLDKEVIYKEDLEEAIKDIKGELPVKRNTTKQEDN